jgi:hypothetical protein
MGSTILPGRPIGGTQKDLTHEQSAELEDHALRLTGIPFTPRLRNGRRIGIILDDVGFRQVRGRGLGNRGVVTDLSSGNQYEITGAACSLHGCVCDAIATKVNARMV